MAKDENRPILPRPLYGAIGPVEFSRTEANTGLWYDKFVNQWGVEKWPVRNAEKVSWSEFIEESARPNSKSKLHIGKLKWIQTVTGFVGSKPLIEEFSHRQKQLVEQSGGRAFVLTTESRFATGLGREHPIENGFAWHHTLGTPYLSGSSIKGMIRNWAEQWEGQTKAEVNSILGGPGSVGRVLVLDALPTQQPLLEADVMTPHYSDYYQKSDAPGDWLSPTPIPFLVVAAGTPFQFALVPNTPADVPHLATVEQWLRDALTWLGAGAKTAVGYGRFAENVDKTGALNPAGALSPRQLPALALPKVNESVEAEIIERKEKAGGKISWRAKHIATKISGPIQNSEAVPSDTSVGQVLQLYVAYANAQEMAFKYPTDAVKQSIAKSQSKQAQQRPGRNRPRR